VPILDLVKLLKKIFDENKIEYDNASIEAIAAAGEGSVRDTLSIADSVVAFGNSKVDHATVMNVLGLSDKTFIYTLAEQIIAGNIGGVLEEINKAYMNGKNLIVLSKNLTVHFRDLLVIKDCKDSKSILNEPSEIFEKWKAQADKISAARLLLYMQKLSAIEAELKYALNPRILLEVVSLECASISEQNIADVKKNGN